MRKLSLKEVDVIEKRFQDGGVSNKDIERLIYSVRTMLESKPSATPKKIQAVPVNGNVEIFTDGACSGNPGPGGWGAIVRAGGADRELSGGERDTTNNRMEMMAAIEALKTLPLGSVGVVTTDSRYLKGGITTWINSWKKNGWKTSQKKPVLNQDLWCTLDELNQKHSIEWSWVEGHRGHPENERCDELAREAILSL